MRRVRQALAPLAARAARAAGLDVLPRDYNSPVPELASLREADWQRRSPLHGIELDAGAMLAWAERELAAHLREPEWPATPPPGGGFGLGNRYYESVDAEILHAVLRLLRPRRVLELGSGWSTLVAAGALAANAREGAPAEYEVHDPHWGPPVCERLDGLGSIDRLRAQDVPAERFAALAAGDVLFVDTSHTVKLGGDVNRIVLDVLPTLAPGVVVHFHDVWLPWEYHRMLVEGMGLYWNEQYLLQAYLAENARWEILWAAQAVAREHGERLRALVPSYRGQSQPSALWIRRREEGR